MLVDFPHVHREPRRNRSRSTALARFDGTDNSYASLDTDVKFDNEFSFAGWVRIDSWTGSYNRVFDFGTNATQGMRLHRNGGSILRIAFNDWDASDFDGYWAVGEYIFVSVTVGQDGLCTAYKNAVEFGTGQDAAPSAITWADTPNYYIAKSNWSENEPNSDMTVHDLRWFDTVIDQDCIDELLATNPPE